MRTRGDACAGSLPAWGLLPASVPLWSTHRATGRGVPPQAGARKLQSFVVLVTAPLGEVAGRRTSYPGSPVWPPGVNVDAAPMGTVQVQPTLAISARRGWVSCR